MHTPISLRFYQRLRIYGVGALLLFALFSVHSVARAAWDGTPYDPGETLDPECGPEDADCRVEDQPPSDMTLDSLTLGSDTVTDLTGQGLVVTGGALTLDTSGDWTGTFDGGEGAWYVANSFSTTSADYWRTQRDFFSSTSAAYFLSQNQGAAFSTTSAEYFLSQNPSAPFSTTTVLWLISQNQGLAFSTTSADAWLATKTTDDLTEGSRLYYTLARFAAALAGTTTDALAEGTTNRYYTDARARSALSATGGITYDSGTGAFSFSTTSISGSGSQLNADLVDGLDSSYLLANSFSTTSANYWKGQNNFFSTTSADYWRTQRDFFSTTSAAYFLAQNQGAAFSTTSAQYFLSQNQGISFSTTSANAWLATKTTDNLAEGLTNRYYTDARARAAVSAAAPGLTYDTSTGVLSLVSGYEIPLTASTSQWNSFYTNPASRIAAGTNLSWSSTTLNALSNGEIRALFSATAPLTYDAATGSFALSTSSISGAGSQLNADYFDGLDSTYFLANSFSTTSANYWKTQNDFFSTTSADYWRTQRDFFSTTSATYFLTTNRDLAFSTTSADAWLGTKTTDNLAEGTRLYFTLPRFAAALAGTTTDALAEGSTNQYYTDTRARAAISSSIPGITYMPGTGVLSLTTGYTIPLTASTTNWNTFYDTPSTRITVGTNLSWAGNTLNGLSTTTLRSLFSASSPLTYDASTGAFTFSTSSISGSGSGLSADYLDGFDFTYFLANSFSTTSANYWKTQNNFFSTTSADYWKTQRDFFSTTSAQYFLAQNQGAAFSTTSAQYFLSQNQPLAFSTTSANAWLATKTTDNLAEGLTNLYYTQGRFDTAFAAKSTTNLPEGVNLYYTNARADARIAAGIAGTTTDALAEGVTNLYYTNARVLSYLNSIDKGYFFSTTSAQYFLAQTGTPSFSTTSADYWKSQRDFFSTTSAAYFLSQNQGAAFSTTSAQYFLSQNQGLTFSTTSANAWLATKTTDNLTEGLANLYYTQGRFDTAFGNKSTTNLAEGTNLYYTNARVLAYLNSIDKGYFFSTTSAQYFLSQNPPAFSTTSADAWLATKTTDSLAEGTTRLYYTDARARAAISSTVPGLTYSSSTGAISLTAGYTIPLTASTTNWNAFYDTPSSRILAGTNLVWDGNTLNGLSTTTIRGLFSATTPLSYNATTGTFTVGTIGVANGGTGATSFGQGWIYSLGGTGALAASTSPTVAWLTATSTTQASSFGLVKIGNPGTFVNSPLSIQGSVNGYLQVNLQNSSSGAAASTDYIATADNGSDGSYYVDLGINSSGYSDAAYNIGGANSAYLYASDGSLTVGTASTTNANAALIFHTGGTTLSQERMRITQAGRVGIGTTTPATALDVNGYITTESVKNCTGIGLALGTDSNGRIGCISISVSVGVSDERLKSDVKPLPETKGLALITSLKPVTYYWKDPSVYGGTEVMQYGFIAQQAKAVDPNLAGITQATELTPDGTYYFNYMGVLAPLVKAVQELNTKIVGMFESFTTKQLHTDKLCVGDVCVTQNQFLQMVQSSGTQPQQSSTPAQHHDSPEEPIVDTPEHEENPDETEQGTPDVQDTQTPEAVAPEPAPSDPAPAPAETSAPSADAPASAGE